MKMKSRWMLFASLLLAGSWVAAQDTGTTSPSSQTGTSDSSPAGQTGQTSSAATSQAGATNQVTPGSASLKGCLAGSASSGKFSLNKAALPTCWSGAPIRFAPW